MATEIALHEVYDECRTCPARDLAAGELLALGLRPKGDVRTLGFTPKRDAHGEAVVYKLRGGMTGETAPFVHCNPPTPITKDEGGVNITMIWGMRDSTRHYSRTKVVECPKLVKDRKKR